MQNIPIKLILFYQEVKVYSESYQLHILKIFILLVNY